MSAAWIASSGGAGQLIHPDWGRPLADAVALLTAAPAPDDDFAADMEAVLESVGATPGDPWAPS